MSTSSRNDNLKLRATILSWFRRHRRDLPWRGTRDPYAIWVSEIMLQQTQVATVIRFYERFLRRFPDVESLAAAPLESVLEVWSGLGYYRRARNLHAAAKKLAAEFGGIFPREPGTAKSLPGVGDYTAAAVLSMAYGVPIAALDGNVARVIARLDARKGSLAQLSFRKAVSNRLDSLISRRFPGDFNQALMELGQTVCLPRAPRCDVCPVRRSCSARSQGQPEQFPAPRPRRDREQHHLAAALIVDTNGDVEASKKCLPAKERFGRRVMFVRGLDDGLMTDLWNFPAAFGASPTAARSALEAKLTALSVGPARIGREVARLRHSVTYRDIQVIVYQAEAAKAYGDDIKWIGMTEFARGAVSQLARKIAQSIPRGIRGAL